MTSAYPVLDSGDVFRLGLNPSSWKADGKDQMSVASCNNSNMQPSSQLGFIKTQSGGIAAPSLGRILQSLSEDRTGWSIALLPGVQLLQWISGSQHTPANVDDLHCIMITHIPGERNINQHRVINRKQGALGMSKTWSRLIDLWRSPNTFNLMWHELFQIKDITVSRLTKLHATNHNYRIAVKIGVKVMQDGTMVGN